MINESVWSWRWGIKQNIEAAGTCSTKDTSVCIRTWKPCTFQFAIRQGRKWCSYNSRYMYYGERGKNQPRASSLEQLYRIRYWRTRWILCNFKENIVNFGVIFTGISYHFMTFCTRNVSRGHFKSHHIIRCLKKLLIESFQVFFI